MDLSLASMFRSELSAAMSAPWAGKENLVGTLVDRHIVSIRGVGEHADDAILVFLEAIRNASNTSSVFNRLWKTIRDDRTVDLWLYNHEERWRSVSFEVQFQRAFPIDDLYMVVSTFVPFGVDGDPSHYPVERSDEYIRGTQDLRAVFELEVTEFARDSKEGQTVSDESDSSLDRDSIEHRNSFGYSNTFRRNSLSKWGVSVEESRKDNSQWPLQQGPMYENNRIARDHSGDEHVNEFHNERNNAGTTEWKHEESRQSEKSHRASRLERVETTRECRAKASFMAIGPDFTQPDRLHAAWRADPANAEPSLAFDMVLASMPSLSHIIEHGVTHRRMSARALRNTGQSLDFWAEALRLVPRYNPEVYGRRVVLGHNGYPYPIQSQDIARALHQAGPELARLIGGTRLLGGR